MQTYGEIIGKSEKRGDYMKCVSCAANLIPTTTSYKLKSIPPIEIHYLEAYKCPQCGEIYLTRTSMKKLKKVYIQLVLLTGKKHLHRIFTI